MTIAVDLGRKATKQTNKQTRRVVVSYKRKYVHEVLVNCLIKLAQEKVWLGELTMTIAVYLGRKATKQTNILLLFLLFSFCSKN